MIVRLPSAFVAEAFLKRHPEPHVIVGYLDRPEPPPREYVYDPNRGSKVTSTEPSWYSVLPWAIWSLELPGDCTIRLLDDLSTLWLAFELEEDAARVRALVGALEEMPVAGECRSAATFTFDLLLHERMAAIRDRHFAAIDAAERSGEGVTYVQPNGETLGSTQPERSQP